MPFDARQFAQEILDSPPIKVVAIQTAKELFQKAKTELIEEFEEHPVTREIDLGGDASNISNTLNGYGNLFSFIGFIEGEDPIGPVKAELEKLEIDEASTVRFGNRFFIKTRGTDYETILGITHLPELQGLSWVDGVEKGISNLGHYIAIKTKYGKSKAGLQVKGLPRGAPAVSKPTPYLSQMLNRFNAKLL